MLFLKKYGTSDTYQIPNAYGDYDHFNALAPNSNIYDEDGNAWSIYRSNSGSKYYIDINFFPSSYAAAPLNWRDMVRLVESLPLFWEGYEIDMISAVDAGDGDHTFQFVAPDNSTAYPSVYYRLNQTNQSGVEYPDTGGKQWQQWIGVQRYNNDYTQAFYENNKITDEGGHALYNQAYAGPILFNTEANPDYYRFGYFVIYYRGAENKYCIWLCWDNNINTDNFVTPVAGKGLRGYRPPKNIAKKPTGGGRVSGKKPKYDTDTLTQPGAPDESVASIIGSGLLNIYTITKANLLNLGTCLFSQTLVSALENLVYHPLDFIVSLNIFPCSPSTGSSVALKLGNWKCESGATTGALGTQANGSPLSSQFKLVDFGTLSVAEMFESFLDYDASSFELYLPFIGAIDIPVSEVMNGSINVQYTIDFLTGMCVANVLCTKNATLASGDSVTQYAQHSYQGNCAVQIPISQTSYSNLVSGLIDACSSGLKSNIAGAAGSLAVNALNGAFTPTVQTKGNILANAGFCSVLYPYITITRPVPVEPENYQETVGYPSYINATLNECQDLCICDSIDLSGVIGATESEINRIRQACLEGVYV